MLGLLSPLSTASWIALPCNAPGVRLEEFGRNGKLPKASPSIGPSLCLMRPPSNAKTTLLDSTPTTLAASPTSGSLSTSSEPSFCTTFGPRGVVSTSTTATPSTKCSSKPGWPLSKSAWPLGRPSEPPGLTKTLTSKIGLS